MSLCINYSLLHIYSQRERQRQREREICAEKDNLYYHCSKRIDIFPPSTYEFRISTRAILSLFMALKGFTVYHKLMTQYFLNQTHSQNVYKK